VLTTCVGCSASQGRAEEATGRNGEQDDRAPLFTRAAHVASCYGSQDRTKEQSLLRYVTRF